MCIWIACYICRLITNTADICRMNVSYLTYECVVWMGSSFERSSSYEWVMFVWMGRRMNGSRSCWYEWVVVWMVKFIWMGRWIIIFVGMGHVRVNGSPFECVTFLWKRRRKNESRAQRNRDNVHMSKVVCMSHVMNYLFCVCSAAKTCTWVSCYFRGFGLCNTQRKKTKCKSLQLKTIHYGVATVSRIDQIIGLFCKRDL